MDYDQQKLADALAKMKPEERVKHLEEVSAKVKKEMQETELFLKQSQELLEKNRKELMKHALSDDQKRLRELEERKKKEEREEQREGLGRLLEQEEKEKSLDAAVRREKLPANHPIVGLYNQLQQVMYSYQDTTEVDYARAIVLEGIRREVVELLSQYKEVPEEMKEIATVTYRLTKDLLGEDAAKRKYMP